MSQAYTALIIDLKKSRRYTKDDRNHIQHYIMDDFHLLNGLYCTELVREVDFSAGDEVQGLFSSPEAAYLYYRMLSTTACSLCGCIPSRSVQVSVLAVGMFSLTAKAQLVKMGQHTTELDMHFRMPMTAIVILFYFFPAAALMLRSTLSLAALLPLQRNQVFIKTKLC